MTNERPASVSVVGWFCIITGGLSVLSAIGYIAVSILNGRPAVDAWPGYVQVLIAGFVIYGGFGLLRASAFMRQALEVASYLIMLILLVYGVTLTRDFSSWLPFLSVTIYTIPFVFIIRALRSQRVRTYASK